MGGEGCNNIRSRVMLCKIKASGSGLLEKYKQLLPFGFARQHVTKKIARASVAPELLIQIC